MRGGKFANKSVNFISSRGNHVRFNSGAVPCFGFTNTLCGGVRDVNIDHVMVRERGLGRVGSGSP